MTDEPTSMFLLLIYEREEAWVNADKETFDEVMAGHDKFWQAHGEQVSSSKPLQPTDSATTVRGYETGEFTVTDGPFLETKEALGGYYLVSARDRDEAIAMAKQLPTLGGGCVEVRPIMVFD